MNIQFCEHGSRIYDFFNLFAHKEHILNRREEEKGYDDVCYTLFLSLLNKAKDMLEQFTIPDAPCSEILYRICITPTIKRKKIC